MNDQSRYWDRLACLPPDASVIDPMDRRGFKNAYLALVRNRNILHALDKQVRSGDFVLDLGCGTGSLTEAIRNAGFFTLGIDISRGLLNRTSERNFASSTGFVQYDGERFPLKSESVSAVTTYVVLNHILDPVQFEAVLTECNRVLRPKGVLVCIEQVRREPLFDKAGWKQQRRVDEFHRAFVCAGFARVRQEVVRYGFFPATWLIGRGMVPRVVYRALMRLEAGLGRIYGVSALGYTDMLFVYQKPAQP